VSPPPPKSRFGIIYDVRSKESVEDAKAILNWMISDEGPSRTKLVPVMVDIRELDDRRDVRASFIAAGMEANYEQIFRYSQKNKVLTISADLSCVRLGHCAVGVNSLQRVEVQVNRQVTLLCGIDFVEAFRMMVTEY
jgi:hypothetical protein